MASHPQKRRMRGPSSGPQKAGWALLALILPFFGIFTFWQPLFLKTSQTSFLVQAQGSFSALPLERCFDCRNLSLKIDFPSSCFSLDDLFGVLFPQNSDKIQTKIQTKCRQKFRQNSEFKKTPYKIWENRKFRQFQTRKFRQNSDKFQAKFRPKFNKSQTKFQTKFQIKIQIKIRTNFRPKLERISDIRQTGCRVLEFLDAQGGSRFQKTQKCSSPFLEECLFFEDSPVPILLFLRMEGALKSASPFLFFMDCVFRVF